MKPTVARTALLLLLVTTVAIRFHALRSRDAMVASFQIDFAIKTLIKENGLPLKENPASPTSILSSAVYFQRPECSESSVVTPFSLNYEALPLLARMVPIERYAHRFAYLDGSWPEQNRVLMFAEWLGHATRNLADMTRYLPVKTAVVVADPAACRIVTSIDWRLVWDREWNRTRIEKRSPPDEGAGATAGQSHVRS